MLRKEIQAALEAAAAISMGLLWRVASQILAWGIGVKINRKHKFKELISE